MVISIDYHKSPHVCNFILLSFSGSMNTRRPLSHDTDQEHQLPLLMPRHTMTSSKTYCNQYLQPSVIQDVLETIHKGLEEQRDIFKKDRRYTGLRSFLAKRVQDMKWFIDKENYYIIPAEEAVEAIYDICRYLGTGRLIKYTLIELITGFATKHSKKLPISCRRIRLPPDSRPKITWSNNSRSDWWHLWSSWVSTTLIQRVTARKAITGRKVWSCWNWNIMTIRARQWPNQKWEYSRYLFCSFGFTL